MSTASKVQFAKWLAANDPGLFRVVVRAHEMKTGKQLSGLGLSFDFLSDIDWKGIASTATDTVKSLAPALAQYKAQAAALKVNMQRAEQGQPPINTADYSPTVKISPEITPESEAAISRVAAQAVQNAGGELTKMLPLLGLGALALIFAMKR